MLILKETGDIIYYFTTLNFSNLVTSIRNVRKVKSVADRQTMETTPMKYRMKVSSCWLKNIEGHGAEQSFLPIKV